MTAQAGQIVEDRFPEYPCENLEAPRQVILKANTQWPKTLARFRKPQWRLHISHIDPLIWYWTRLCFYDDAESLTGRHGSGASWLELAMDFEISTRIPLTRGGPDNATEHIRERAGLMSDISKALPRGLGSPLKTLNHTLSLYPSIQK